jgi:hypothetical protein
MNATVIMISQGAMVFGGLIWSSAAALAGPIHTLLGASVLFLASLLLAGRLSINVRTDLEEKVSGLLSGTLESGEGGANCARKRIGRSLNDSHDIGRDQIVNGQAVFPTKIAHSAT